jgi:hypothetical protein
MDEPCTTHMLHRQPHRANAVLEDLFGGLAGRTKRDDLDLETRVPRGPCFGHDPRISGDCAVDDHQQAIRSCRSALHLAARS